MRVAELSWFDSFLSQYDSCCNTHQQTNEFKPQQECREKLGANHSTADKHSQRAEVSRPLHHLPSFFGLAGKKHGQLKEMI